MAQRFKGQLKMLVERLSATSPHFVRCIKPNTQLAADLFDPGLVLQQVSCAAPPLRFALCPSPLVDEGARGL